MLQPKRTKFRKQHKGRNRGLAHRGSTVSFGEYGLKSTGRGRMTARQIEAGRRAMTRHIKRGGQIWIRVFPDKPITSKPLEVRQGKGKGNVLAKSKGCDDPILDCCWVDDDHFITTKFGAAGTPRGRSTSVSHGPLESPPQSSGRACAMHLCCLDECAGKRAHSWSHMCRRPPPATRQLVRLSRMPFSSTTLPLPSASLITISMLQPT